jgi:quercetin dioxygenase-like cupin family protein
MYRVTTMDSAVAVTPPNYARASQGYAEQVLVDRSTGSPHLELRLCLLGDHGYIDAVVHSFEVSVYVFEGSLAVTAQGSTTRLDADHAMIVPVGVTYSVRALEGPARWLHVNAPSQIADGRRQDTFFTGRPLPETSARLPDGRDPRDRHALGPASPRGRQ